MYAAKSDIRLLLPKCLHIFADSRHALYETLFSSANCSRKGTIMTFFGISRVFSTENDAQYESIGIFWDELSKKYGRNNLRGLGYNWTANTIEYVIGLKEGKIEGYNCSVELPDDNWKKAEGKLSDLGKIYEEIYKGGSLKYEIEMIYDDGHCEILYRR